MPGSSLPSRYSRLAPPPVEMWPNAASSKPSLRTAAAESPPPTTERPVDLGERLGDGAGALGERVAPRRRPSGRSRTPSARRRAAAANAAADSGPMSRPRLSAGISDGRHDLRLGRRGHRTGTRCRPRCRSAARSPRRSRRPARGSRGRSATWSSSSRLLPTSWPWAARNVNTMPPPISSLSALVEQVVDHAQLVGDLRAAEHHDVRALRVDRQPPEYVDLRGHQLPHGVREQLGDVVDRRLLAVHHAEPVGHERVGQLGQLARRTRSAISSSLLVSPGLNRTFSSTATCAVLEPRDGLGGALTHGVGGEGDRAAEQLAEPLGDRRQGVRRVRLALGPAEVGDHDDPGAGVGQRLDGRDAGADPAVVGDRAAVERHVQVGADQDPLAPQARRGSRCRGVVLGHGQSDDADVGDQVGEAVGVAPLVVVPADDLDLVADHLGERGVEDAGRRVGDDVGRDDRVGGVPQEAAVGGLLDRGVDLVDARSRGPPRRSGRSPSRSGPGPAVRSRRACP